MIKTGDPMNVTAVQLRAAYDALGLDPDRFDQTVSFTAEPGKLTVIRMRVDQDGAAAVAGIDEVATETITIGVDFI